LLGSLVDLEENAVVDLEKTQKLENFARFRSDLVDTEAQK